MTYEEIRRMISDSRMIANYTGLPQWLISEVKRRLFYRSNKADKDTCDWWSRLYRGDYEKADISLLQWAIEGKEIDIKGRTYK